MPYFPVTIFIMAVRTSLYLSLSPFHQLPSHLATIFTLLSFRSEIVEHGKCKEARYGPVWDPTVESSLEFFIDSYISICLDIDQWLSNPWVHQYHLEGCYWAPRPEFLIQEVWGKAQEFAFLMDSQMMLMLLVQGLYLRTTSVVGWKVSKEKKSSISLKC